ncbi:uncharacterized protein G2W53_006971 [Senna tora]|uniref:Uncharacterized protein n=1 Tax=Senna tora TaxID=362788 RepID=A0A834X657_9FABA|nr:uncharacterized protein G2W53_006971 [Senna tora]
MRAKPPNSFNFFSFHTTEARPQNQPAGVNVPRNASELSAEGSVTDKLAFCVPLVCYYDCEV